jgi:2-aminoethylphosphonate-pyruvate transaminase
MPNTINTAVILAAGLGSRLNNRLKEKPKGFIEMGDQTLIERSIAILMKHGIKNVIIGSGFRSEFYEKISQQDDTISCFKNPMYQDSGSFYTFYNMRELLNGDILLLESDILYEERAISALVKHVKNDVILASGRTYSSDEVFIETDRENYLKILSKDISKLSKVDGELVGISRISRETYRSLFKWAANNEKLARHIHYEDAIAQNCKTNPIYIETIRDLIWTEIDTENHYENARDNILPKIKKKAL